MSIDGVTCERSILRTILRTISRVLIVFFALSPVVFSSISFSNQSRDDIEKASQFDEISLLYDFNEQEIEFIKNSGPKTLCFVFFAGRPDFDLRYMRWLIEDTGLSLNLGPPVSWSEGIEAIKNKGCDILPEATKTEARSKSFNFTRPYSRLNHVIFTKAGRTSHKELHEVLDQNLLILKNSYLIPVLKELYPNIKLEEVEHEYEGLKKVDSSYAFGFIGNEVLNQSPYRQSYRDVIPSIVLDKQFDDIYSFATRKEEILLHQILEKAITKKIQGMNERQMMFQFLNDDSSLISMSYKEKKYVSDNPTIRLCQVKLNEGSDTAVSLAKYLTRETKLNITVSEPHEWSDAINKLLNGECDLLPNITETVERRKLLAFSKPYIRVSRVLITLKTHPFSGDISSYQDKRIAIVKGDIVKDVLLAKYPNIQITEVMTPHDASLLVESGEVDGQIDVITTAENLLYIYDLDALKINFRLSSEYDDLQAFAAREEDSVLMEIINKHIDLSDKTKIASLLRAEPLKNISDQFLNSSERSYLRNNLITICNPNLGQPIKNVVDYLLEKTQANYEFNESTTWSDALEQLKRGECHMLPQASETKKRRAIMHFTPPFYQEERGILTSNEQPFILNFNDYASEKYAVIKGDVLAENLLEEFPTIDLSYVKDTETAVELVSRKEVFGYIDSITNIVSRIDNKHSALVKISGTLPEKYNDQWSIATRKDNQLLNSILSKLISNSNPNVIENILLEYNPIKYQKGIDYRLITQVVIIFLIVFASFVYWNRRLSVVKSKVKVLLDSSGEGYFSFGRNLRVDSEFSRKCLDIFTKKSMDDQTVDELLFQNDGDSKDTFVKGVGLIFKASDEKKRRVFADLLPKRSNVNSRILSLNYSLLKNRIIVIAKDITEEIKLREQIEKEHLEQCMIVYALSHKNEVLFINQELEEFLIINDVKNIQSVDKKAGVFIYQKLHTFKSLCMQIYFNRTADVLHGVESLLLEFISSDVLTDDFVQRCEMARQDSFNALYADQAVLNTAFNIEFFQQRNEYKISEEKLNSLKKLSNSNKQLLCELNEIQYFSAKEILKNHIKTVKEYARTVGIDIDKSVIEGVDIKLDSKYLSFFLSTIHIFRNIVAHGIEPPEVREKIGKCAAGRIEVCISIEGDRLKLIIADDGKGIASSIANGVSNKSNNTKYQEGDEVLWEEDEIQKMCKNAILRQTEVTFLSGRGTGLSAVLRYTKLLDGTLRIRSVPNQSTHFEFVISLNHGYSISD
ncbi:transporter substrate-binding domain-containing protein [Pleionea sediminis]|uniref:transporter substrate-binding domain-containing protein n=1 Tax=Pleionea sediminis TaxID=2569479 RepID=UPI0013DD8EA6|nr:transporter substrate-binding domain-containing protein [Pleionea sediminis]